MKICIIGYSGSGKSSFAAKLGLYYKIEPTFIDKLQFEPGWKEREPKVRNQMLESVVSTDNWVVDGNYTNAVPERFIAANQIFIFDFNRFKCLYGAVKRSIRFKNKTRLSMTKGNEERLPWSFVYWILFKSRTKKRSDHYKRLLRQNPHKTIVFKKRSAVNKYLKSLGITDFKAESVYYDNAKI